MNNPSGGVGLIISAFTILLAVGVLLLFRGRLDGRAVLAMVVATPLAGAFLAVLIYIAKGRS